MAGEGDRDTKEQLRLALLRIRSGGVGEAVRNLLDLVSSGLAPESAPVATVLRYASWHDSFVACVDEARSARLGTPRGAIDACQRLGELLTEQALMVVLMAGDAKSQAEGVQLRDNVSKPDIGNVAGRQMPPVGAAQIDRGAHRVTPATSARRCSGHTPTRPLELVKP